jgi:hypothetical protein
MQVIVVTGGRGYTDRNHVRNTLDTLLKEHGNLIIAHGGCNCREDEPDIGADYFASEWADDNECVNVKYFADWGTYGRAAGPIRNEAMVEGSMAWKAPAIMIAFPGGRGTKNAIEVAKKHGLEVKIV